MWSAGSGTGAPRPRSGSRRCGCDRIRCRRRRARWRWSGRAGAGRHRPRGELLHHDAVEALPGIEKRPEPAGKLDEVVAEDAEQRPGVEVAAGELRGGAARRLGHVLVAGAGRGAQRQRLEPAVGVIDLAGILPDRPLAAGGDQRAAKLRRVPAGGPAESPRHRRGAGQGAAHGAAGRRPVRSARICRIMAVGPAEIGRVGVGAGLVVAEPGDEAAHAFVDRGAPGASSPRGRGASNSAKVSGTSPGCSGRSSRIACGRARSRARRCSRRARPARCCRCCRGGRARPRWPGRGRRRSQSGSGRAGRSEARITPSTMSSI